MTNDVLNALAQVRRELAELKAEVENLKAVALLTRPNPFYPPPYEHMW